MCANYKAANTRQVKEFVELIGEMGDEDREIFPGYEAPVITLDKETGERRAEMGIFGLVPHWARDTKICRSTFNARSETVAEKPSFKTAWSHANFCLIPVQWYYEPKYDENGKHPIRWAIGRSDAEAFCIAGIYWRPKGEGVTNGLPSFSMLTVNATDHPVMKDFHAPEDEKRSIVHIPPSEFDAWLTATSELARVMLTLPDSEKMFTKAAPMPPRVKKVRTA